MAEPKEEDPSVTQSEGKHVKALNMLKRAKEEIKVIIHHDKSPRHTKETHGTSNDIDEITPMDEVKGPSVIERVKEEIESLVQAIHPKKEFSSPTNSPSSKTCTETFEVLLVVAARKFEFTKFGTQYSLLYS